MAARTPTWTCAVEVYRTVADAVTADSVTVSCALKATQPTRNKTLTSQPGTFARRGTGRRRFRKLHAADPTTIFTGGAPSAAAGSLAVGAPLYSFVDCGARILSAQNCVRILGNRALTETNRP